MEDDWIVDDFEAIQKDLKEALIEETNDKDTEQEKAP